MLFLVPECSPQVISVIFSSPQSYAPVTGFRSPPPQTTMNPMTAFRTRARTTGFTLVELLVVIAFLGIMLVIGSFSYVSSIKNANNVGFVEGLAQDINKARSTAMAKGVRTQIVFTSANTYSVSKLDAAGNPVSPPIGGDTNANVTMSGINAGDKLICTSIGFCLAYTSAGVLKTISYVDFAYNGKTRRLTITVLGLTRVES